jgi:hypothetical protein
MVEDQNAPILFPIGAFHNHRPNLKQVFANGKHSLFTLDAYVKSAPKAGAKIIENYRCPHSTVAIENKSVILK